MSRITSLHATLARLAVTDGMPSPDTQPAPRLRWVVTEGPQMGQVFTTASAEITIGAAPTSGLVLADPTVSWNHATVQATPRGLVIKDHRSKNGTFVDGHRIIMAFLAPGARVKLGRTVLDVRLERDGVQSAEGFAQLVGRSSAMLELFSLLKRVAATDSTVILCGETGTGKEVAARAVHDASRRSAGPFIVLDCSYVDRDLVGSELFGHEVGAFTGATTRRQGVFEQAHGGTLLIDELGELPLEMQAKLLRVLERREVKRLGGATTIPVDCRVIAATHRDLPEMVRNGRFRQDLYFRLAQINVQLPALRDRCADIPVLVEHILRTRNPERPLRMGAGALAALMAHAFPGNVRELKNIVHRACDMCLGPEITAEDLQLVEVQPDVEQSTPVTAKAIGRAPTNLAAGKLQSAEREVIQQALEQHSFNRMRAASDLGISVPTLRARIRRYRIALPRRDDEE